MITKYLQTITKKQKPASYDECRTLSAVDEWTGSRECWNRSRVGGRMVTKTVYWHNLKHRFHKTGKTLGKATTKKCSKFTCCAMDRVCIVERKHSSANGTEI